MKTIEPINTDKESYIIFASDLDQAETIKQLGTIPHKVLQGMYKGVKETSYIVNLNERIEKLGLIDNQESILLLGMINENGNRDALLVMNGSEDVDLGEFVHADMDQVKASDGYTYDPSTETYYVCIPKKKVG